MAAKCEQKENRIASKAKTINPQNAYSTTNHLMFVMPAASVDTAMKTAISMMLELQTVQHMKYAFLPAQVRIYQMKKSKP